MALSLVRQGASAPPVYAELHARSAFSLLDGASTPEALVGRAKELGLAALAVVDRDDLGGAVRLHRAALDADLRVVHGATLTLDDRSALPLLVRDREGWGNLCRLLSDARLRRRRGEPRTSWDGVLARSAGLFALTGGESGPLARALDTEGPAAARALLERIVSAFGRDHVAVEVWRHGLPRQDRLIRQLVGLAESVGVPWVPTNDVRYARAADRRAYDVMTCLRSQVTLDQAGTRLLPSDSWHLRSPAEMATLWRGHHAALERSVAIAARCAFDLAQLRPRLPRFTPARVAGPRHASLDGSGDACEDDRHDDGEAGAPTAPARTPAPHGDDGRGDDGGGDDGRGDDGRGDDGRGDDQALRQLVADGAERRYGPSLTARQRDQIEHELRVIAALGLAGYFLIVHDIVAFARSHDILCQGRGSAANSAVCYCLGITAIDPIGMELLFERFLSEGRTDPPDIDVDISHMDRERVLQYVYERYGRRHAAMVCTTITWRGRSAVRDVSRVLGFDPEVGARLALEVGGCEAAEAADRLAAGGAAAAGLDANEPRVAALVDVVRRLDRLPRHRSIHTGGFVLTAEPLDSVVPIESASMHERTVIQWDKDDLAPVGLVKIDLLGLGILTVIDKALHFLRATRGLSLGLHQLPMDDDAVYAQIADADTVGLFQVESRAQMNTLPRLRPSCFYDLVVQVALIRPGPIQGEMVHPYIRRRRGEEPVTYLHPDLEPVLRRTLGIPLFQEQGMKVAITMAGFSPGQADRLRKIMGFKRAGDHLRPALKALWEGMRARGLDSDTALRILHQLEGFANYGFPESHAASFALLTYASAYLRHHFHPEYLAAILDAQPMGFYSPGSLVHDARQHGVEVRPVDVVFSAWGCTLELDVSPPAVRVGLRLVRGLSTAARELLQRALEGGPLGSLDDLVRRADEVGLPDHVLVTLARAGAFRTLWPGRRSALWEVLRRLRERKLPLKLRGPDGRPFQLPSMTAIEEAASDYQHVGLSHERHPMVFHRDELGALGIRASGELRALRHGSRVTVAGLAICRQRPESAKGVFFMTLEDELGMVNVVVMPQVFEANRLLLATAPALVVDGIVEQEQGVINVLGHRFTPLRRPRGGGEYTRSRSFR